MAGEAFVVVLAIIFLVLVFRFNARGFDEGRIGRYITERGGKLLDCSWAPFGPGWFGENVSRIYRITYRDTVGNVHEAYARTSLFSAVYLTNDQIVQPVEQPKPDEASSLAEENRRLRERIRELEQRQS